MLIIMGTSLSIKMLGIAVKSIAKAVSGRGGMVVLVNKTRVTAHAMWQSILDYHVEADLDDWIKVTVGHWLEANPSDWGSAQPVHPDLLKQYSLLPELR
jgi:NAD-dependent SIR2 family protein deacetylase